MQDLNYKFELHIFEKKFSKWLVGNGRFIILKEFKAIFRILSTTESSRMESLPLHYSRNLLICGPNFLEHLGENNQGLV